MSGGRTVGLLELAEDFRFAHHHGIQAAGHSKEVPHAREGILGEKRCFQATCAGPEKLLDGIHDRCRSDARGVEFHAVAGRDNHRAREAFNGSQII